MYETELGLFKLCGDCCPTYRQPLKASRNTLVPSTYNKTIFGLKASIPGWWNFRWVFRVIRAVYTYTMISMPRQYYQIVTRQMDCRFHFRTLNVFASMNWLLLFRRPVGIPLRQPQRNKMSKGHDSCQSENKSMLNENSLSPIREQRFYHSFFAYPIPRLIQWVSTSRPRYSSSATYCSFLWLSDQVLSVIVIHDCVLTGYLLSRIL